MKQLTILSFAILFSGTFFCQTLQTVASAETTISVKETPIMYHRARIYYNGPKGILLLANQGLAVDHGKHKFGVYIESDFSENEIQKAKMLGMKVEIQIEDVKKFYIQQNQEIKRSTPLEKNSSCGSSSASYPVPVNYNHGSMGGFLTLDELYQELDEMATLYPNLISVKAPISNFTTHEGRSIYWMRMSDNPNIDETEPEVLYTAIHHAREPESMQQLVYYMWYMLENYATNTEVQGILDNTELYFVPMINPDGYQHNVDNDPNGGGMHRKNKRNTGASNPGVDNNRNYDYIDGSGNSIWGTSGVSSDPNSDVYPGTGPFTEPENQAIKWFVENHNIKLALNNHTSGNLLLYPYGYANNQLTLDNNTYVAISGMMVAENGFNNMISASLYPAAGDSDDFMYGETSTHGKIFAFTPEIGGTGFWPAVNEIDPIAEEMVYLNLTAAHLVTNYAETNDLTASIVPDLSGYFHYDIQRLGLENPANFTVSIIPITSNIINVGGANSHNAMALLQQENDSISYTLDPAIIPGNLITYVISVDNGQYISNDTVTKIYGQTQIVFAESGNNLNSWSSSASWNTTTATFYSPSSSITDSPGGNYSHNINNSITLTSGVDLNHAVAATLSFYGKWEIEDGYDYVQLEISTDGGVNWIPQCGNYTNAGSSNQVAGEPLYDGFQSSWVKEEISLDDYLGQTIKARFTIVSDGGVREDGFYFDDFQISVVSCDTSSSVINDVFCGSYNLNGQVYNAPGTYSQTLTNGSGCDSIITLSLNLDSTSNTINDVFCGSYILNGQTYSSPGTYTQTLTNAAGCDSVITLNLSFNSSSSTITQSSCGSYTLNNQTYTSSGTYTQTLTNVAGCDSIITLNLTVNPNQFSPDFTVSSNLFSAPPFAAQFTNTTPNSSNYNFTWDFSDGTILQSNNSLVFHEYLYNGLYDVTLIAEDINTGCTDTIFYDDYIYCTGGTSCTHASTINQTGPITACVSDSVVLSCNTGSNFTYQWRLNGTYIPGAVDTIYYPTQTGNYSVLIMDNGCPEVSPDVSVVISSSPQTPIITSSGNITPCLGGSVTLSVPNTYSSYNWSSGGTSSSEVVTSSGSYFVTVSNSTACEATSPTYTINASFAAPPDVCIVGVDSITNYNKVVWEKLISTAIDSFYVYKESNQANIYQKIGGTSYSDTAVFNDLSSNPAAQAYRYKLSLVDSCGIESSLGSMHKSIHLTINQGVGTTWNLIWSHYEGFTFPSYNIYRGTSSTNMTLLTTIASNLNSYTDLTATAGQLFYQIEVVSNYTCDPLKSNYNVSRSNVVDNAEAPSIIVQQENSNVNVYPNPTQDQITIDIKGYNGPVNVEVYDLQGRLLETTTNTIMSLKKHAKGIYVLKVSYGEITEEVRVVRD